MRNGGDMSTVMRFIPGELGKYPQLLVGLSQGAFPQQNQPNIAGLLNAVPNRDQFKGLITSAKAALEGGDIDKALGALLGQGHDKLLEPLSRGDTGETVKKLEELYLNAKGPFGLKDVDLGQLKKDLSGKDPNLVVSKFVGLFSEDGTNLGKDVKGARRGSSRGLRVHRQRGRAPGRGALGCLAQDQGEHRLRAGERLREQHRSRPGLLPTTLLKPRVPTFRARRTEAPEGHFLRRLGLFACPRQQCLPVGGGDGAGAGGGEPGPGCDG